MKEIKKNLADIRNDYKKKELSEKELQSSPLNQFNIWLNEAIKSNVYEPTASTFSTVSNNNRPTARIILLKGVTESGLVFFTNYNSKKGKDLKANNAAAMTFFWPELERQVRIEGFVEKISEKKSEEYFYSRPFESRIGALISPQSQAITKEELEKRYAEAKDAYNESTLKKPAHWGGYCLFPDYYEFWQGRPGRLHDRLIYKLEDDEWKTERLAP